MQKEQQDLLAFVGLHGSRLRHVRVKEPTAFLMNHSDAGIPLNARFTRYTVNDIVRQFDTNDKTILWLLHQMKTYDLVRCNVLGLVFSEKCILAHVIDCESAAATP